MAKTAKRSEAAAKGFDGHFQRGMWPTTMGGHSNGGNGEVDRDPAPERKPGGDGKDKRLLRCEDGAGEGAGIR